MKKGVLLYLLGGFFAIILGFGGLGLNYVNADGEGECNGIRLNTDFPIIGNCISLKNSDAGVDATNVLPYMIGSLMKIIMSIGMLVCFIMIIYAGILRTSGDTKKAGDLIKKVAITILALGLSGVILKVINPLFFS